MKKVLRSFSILMVIFMLIGSFSIFTYASYEELSFYGTEGETEYFIIHTNAYDEITEGYIVHGEIPGMWLEISGGATLGLAGVPTEDGEYVVDITMTTVGLGTVDYRVTVYVNPSVSSDGVPVVTKNPTSESVIEGDSAIFVARASNTRQYVWEIALGETLLTCEEAAAYFGKGISFTGYDTETLVIHNIPAELDGAMVWCQFVGAEESVTSTVAKISVTPIEKATPVVTKNPTDETVEVGGEAVFVAKANYAMNYRWQLISPEGIRYDCADAPKDFKGLAVYGANTEQIVLENIPIELNGYRIRCIFTAGNDASSEMAHLYVIEKGSEVDPDESPAASPESSAVPEKTPAPTETPKAAEPTDTDTDSSDKAPQKHNDKTSTPDTGTDVGGRNNTIIIVAIVAGAAVAIAAIGAFVFLKLKGRI
ncbi:MAG: hypothetical protein J6P94_05250 [Oscillospiraceae bacterium]|nr:hypothetical protein [Oscillospiraceae bacterium]